MSAPHPRWSLASQAVPPTVPTVDLTRLTKLHWILNLLGLLAVHVDIEVPISPHCVGETKDLLIFLPRCIPEWQLLGIKYLQSWGTNRGVHMAKISKMGGVLLFAHGDKERKGKKIACHINITATHAHATKELWAGKAMGKGQRG